MGESYNLSAVIRHNILQPKYGEDYIRPAWLGGNVVGLLEGGNASLGLEG